jgi:hypothetical protein
MNETDDIQRRWRELAEQLGLPPEPTAPAEPALPPTQVLREPESAAAEAPEPGERTDNKDQTLEAVREEPTDTKGAEPVGAATEPEESPREERRHSRGRRRGRRGGRKTEPSAAETSEEETGAAETTATQADDEAEPAPERSRRRGRGRSRSRKAVAEEEMSEPAEETEEQQEEEPAPQPAAVEEDEEDDDMSGWSIPSWQELISSLYRPDR